ncbi:MAG: endopeptidase La [Cyanobacteria bacterium J007]|nr:MAG: endopeptidase La [Cyanobacteria bacterium J007]
MDVAPISSQIERSVKTGLLFPLRNIILLPGITLPIVAGRPRSVAVAEATLLTPTRELVVASVRPEIARLLDEDPHREIENLDSLYPIATLAVVQRTIRLPLGPLQLIVEGQERVRLEELLQRDPTYEVRFQTLPALSVEGAIDRGMERATLDALTGALQSLWREAASLNPNFPDEVLSILLNADDPIQLAYQSCILLQQEIEQMQAVLEENDLETLMRRVLANLQSEMEVMRLRREILGETKKEIDQKQREYILREQLKKIQEELGDGDPDRQEVEELRSRLKESKLPESAAKQAKRELARLERIGSASAEGGVIRTYLDWLLEMPWNRTVEDNLDLDNARAVLDADHHDLTPIKDRIVEHLATFKLKQVARATEDPSTDDRDSSHQRERYSVGTALCFTGPPGVGKTSLGRSIARALGRPFERLSLGGLRDEAELRGHRRTYIGAMPGRIVQALHRAGVNNPVIMLDELDKVGMDYRGDPASVLLEILDPQQNYSFRDLYLDLDFDLSQVFFIGTANDLSKVPPPLLDRLEIIELSGYSEREKRAIAREYLLPRQIEKAGLPPDALILPEETLSETIAHYTREAGVRKLEQQIGALCRKVAVRYANGDSEPMTVTADRLETLLGPAQFLGEEIRDRRKPGIATGLAWTLQGGEILFVEAALLPEGKDLTITGQLGKVMQESAHLARAYVWSNAATLGIDSKTFKENGLHLHVPAGAIPKDGPSAGVTIVAAIASLLMQQPTRTDTAMTGEINLSGEVLPIGGLREKVLAAHRAGVTRVLIPRRNQKDAVDIPEDVREVIELVACDRIEEILAQALQESKANPNSKTAEPLPN